MPAANTLGNTGTGYHSSNTTRHRPRQRPRTAASDAKSNGTKPYVDTFEVGFEAGPDESGLHSSALDHLMEELSQGQAAKWKSTEEVVVEGGLDLLLPADVQVATMLRQERL